MSLFSASRTLSYFPYRDATRTEMLESPTSSGNVTFTRISNCQDCNVYERPVSTLRVSVRPCSPRTILKKPTSHDHDNIAKLAQVQHPQSLAASKLEAGAGAPGRSRRAGRGLLGRWRRRYQLAQRTQLEHQHPPHSRRRRDHQRRG